MREYVHHDGSLYWSRSAFQKAAKRINRYAKTHYAGAYWHTTPKELARYVRQQWLQREPEVGLAPLAASAVATG